MAKSLSSLRSEHEVILKALNVLNILESNKLEVREDLLKILEFIENFVDNCHHVKEEKALFPILEEKGFPSYTGPIFVMLNEHNQLRELIPKIRENLKNEEFNELEFNLASLSSILTSHIDKENSVLFPMAESLISENEDEELLEKFEEIENNFGIDRHKKYIKDIESIYRKYFK
jgi:hemerythrin-like domain-containing protein